MSARKVEKKRHESVERKVSSPDDVLKTKSALYLYCIGEAHTLRPLMAGPLPAAIEDGELELVEAGGLAAVASRVPLNDYDASALPSHMMDAAWMALRAMRHERVVDYFATRASVIPLRFGVIYLEREGIEKMLDKRSEELRANLERLRGREEWGINVFCDRKILMEAIVNFSARLRELSEEAAKASPGQAYLMRKKIDSMRKDEARAETKRVVERIEQELQTVSDNMARLRILKDEAGEQGELVGKLTFLVERARFDKFRSAAEALAGEHEGAGFRLELTGPWPAYNFVVSN